ncbi:ABC transporter ATP-binding protein [Rubeoparvulum massiliense]|uniref:ABC transporter ATP-binding protein n=1 Tax=Rubeoparvulum massiliense TaxID=1631346 RepID=UPI00065E225D|nr:ABC transporter ATP-binding protein [Rubeoparvulum massiliense]
MLRLEVEQVVKRFKQVEAVSGVNLTLKEGEILGLLGPNGAGKSTLISMISSLIRPDEGEIHFMGNSIFSNPQPLRKVLGVVPQDIALYPDLSGYENLQFFGKAYGLQGKVLKERVEEVLTMIGLQDKAKQRIDQYSGGMKRRVNIGAALLHHPKILIMDEPTVGIDPQSRNHILETVKQLNKEGLTILYTSHYMEEVEFLCERLYIMDHGKVIAEGMKEDLKARYTAQNILEMEVEGSHPALLPALQQGNFVHVQMEGNRYRITCPDGDHATCMTECVQIAGVVDVNITSLQVKKPTLEDVFLQLTGRGLRN